MLSGLLDSLCNQTEGGSIASTFKRKLVGMYSRK